MKLYHCPGCDRKASPDGGVLCGDCTDEMVALNAASPDGSGEMPADLWEQVSYVFVLDEFPTLPISNLKEGEE